MNFSFEVKPQVVYVTVPTSTMQSKAKESAKAKSAQQTSVATDEASFRVVEDLQSWLVWYEIALLMDKIRVVHLISI